MTQKSAQLKLHESIKLVNLHPALYIAMQKTAILDTAVLSERFVQESKISSNYSKHTYWVLHTYCGE
jgi:hypothetical protein